MSLYRNRPSEATSFSVFHLTIWTLLYTRLMILLVASFILLPSPAPCGFWNGMLTVPQLSERYPVDSAKVTWDRSDMNVLCVVQVMDGLGRRQVEEINRLRGKIEEKATLVLVSIDRDESKKWPLDYIRATWDRLSLSIPIFDLPQAARKDLFRGFDPSRIKILPQTLFFNNQRTLLRIVEGFQTAEALESVLNEVRTPIHSPDPHPIPEGSILVNGGFEEWPAGNLLPTGWEVRERSSATLVHVENPPGTPTGIAEIRNGTTPKRQILFHRLPNSPALLGQKVRLSASARSNCIGRPVVALAMPTNEGGMYRFTPESPFITNEGKEIPLRILTACDFEANTQAWQHMTHETLMPERGKLFVVVLYLEDAGAPFAAGQFDNISLEVLGK